MGQAAVNALLEEVGGTPAPHSEFVFLPELVVRGSTAAGPTGQNAQNAPLPAQSAAPKPDGRKTTRTAHDPTCG
jgi:hypothetical protein